MSILRPYQRQALDVLWSRLAEGQETRLAMEMATGLGKTVTGAAGAVEWLDNQLLMNVRDKRVLVLVHTDEITEQWVTKLEFVARGRYTVGVVKAGRNEPAADIVVASVQTIASRERRNAIRDVGLIIVDESHHAVAPTYMTILRHFGVLPDYAARPHLIGPWDGYPYSGPIPALGLTATLARSDGQALGHVWQDLVFSRGIRWAQRQGWLLDIMPWTIKVPDITAASSDAALDAMLADGIAPETVVDAWEDKACGLSTVLFAPLVKSAQAFADAFNMAGIKAEVIHGGMGSAERRGVLDRYEAGTTTILCNAMVLTEGWDSPRTMCVIWARPTTSVPLFIQGVGRGLRPWLDASAPPRDEQVCVLLCVTDTSGARLATVADLSDRPLDEAADGKTLQQMEDEFDLGRELDEQERAYRGPVTVEAWDPLVAASSKAWKYTKEGVPFLPTAKKSQGYVFVVGTTVYAFMEHPNRRGKYGSKRVEVAPDISLAMALAEDVAQDLGGDIGALLADKKRAWRKAVPSHAAVAVARSAGVPEKEIQAILSSKSAGKAGKLSDLTEKMMASRTLDPMVNKIREKATA